MGTNKAKPFLLYLARTNVRARLLKRADWSVPNILVIYLSSQSLLQRQVKTEESCTSDKKGDCHN